MIGEWINLKIYQNISCDIRMNTEPGLDWSPWKADHKFSSDLYERWRFVPTVLGNVRAKLLEEGVSEYTYHKALHGWLGSFWKISCWWAETECDASAFWRMAYIPDDPSVLHASADWSMRENARRSRACVCLLRVRVRVPANVARSCYTARIVYTFSYVIRDRALSPPLSSRSDK